MRPMEASTVTDLPREILETMFDSSQGLEVLKLRITCKTFLNVWTWKVRRMVIYQQFDHSELACKRSEPPKHFTKL